MLLHDVRPWGDDPVDLEVTGEQITAVSPAMRTAPAGPEVVDGRGLLAVPGFVNAHAHVDKSWWGRPWVSYAGEPTVQGRIAHERAHRDELGIPGVDVTTAVLREFLRHGTTAVRTHVDVDLGLGLRGIDVVRESAASLGDAVELQIVAFPQDGVVRRSGVLELLERAAVEGADFVGGLDPASIDRAPVEQLDGLFSIAEWHGVGLDVHLHDPGELGAFQIELILDRTVRSGLQHRVNVSHGFALGEVAPGRQDDLVAAAAEAGVSWTTVAPLDVAPLPLSLMRDRGVAVGLGTDGIRDLWSPYGDGDILQIARTFAQLHRLRTDEDLRYAIELGTRHAGRFVGRERHDLVVGARADIVLVDADNVADLLVRAPRRELVVAGGRVVAGGGELVGV